MKICPVCNESFADELNFCDVDGTRLAREAAAQERNKWWSLLGAGLLVAAVLISAASIIFLPRARVSPVVVNPEPQSSTVPLATPSVDNAPSVASSTASPEPEQASSDAIAPELKKKDREFANGNSSDVPNPKAATLSAEEGAKNSASIDTKKTDTPLPKPEPTLPVSTVSDPRPPEAAPKPLPPPPDLKKDHSQPATTKSTDKDQNAKKKDDEKDKKKGGFLRVFKKIFGKD